MRRRAVGLVCLAVTLSSCGDGRSAEAFCSTYREEEERLIEKYSDRTEFVRDQEPFAGLLTGIVSLFEAQGDYVVLLDRLEQVAPEEIQPEVAAIRDVARANIEGQNESLGSGNLGQAGVGGLLNIMQVMGSVQRVDQFVQTEC